VIVDVATPKRVVAYVDAAQAVVRNVVTRYTDDGVGAAAERDEQR
jgi:hypothetical protein